MTGSLKIAKLDFFTMKPQLAMYLTLVLFVVMFGFMGASVSLLCVNVAWYTALLSSNIFAIQEKNNLERLYGSVSIKLKDVVLGRYIYSLCNFIISCLSAIALYLIIMLFQNATIELSDIIIGISLSLFVFSTITGLQMPIYFKVGYTKAKVWSLIPYIGVLALVFIPQVVSDFSGLIEFMKSNQSVLIVCGILASCLIQYTSYKIAVVAYRKRR